ncbi:MAG TPA: glycosyltransferase [Candidatus Binatia bacterium]|nr:glycosyltransferase [Candidatus Binatia bacterium]
MKIAIVHPYPVSERAVGGTTRVYLLARHLAARHSVRILTHASGDPIADAAAVRAMADLGVAQEIFARPRATVGRKLAWALGHAPYFVGHNRNPALEAALARLDATDELDVVHVEFAYLAPVLGALGPRPARVLAEQETMSVVVERLHAVPSRRLSLYQVYLSRQLAGVRRFEAQAVRTFDRAFAINEAEAALLSRVAGREVAVLPHVVAADAFRAPAAEPREPVLLFVGNYAHDPNRHAVLWFAESVWPRVCEEAGDAALAVVGPHLPPAEALELARRGARLLGRVDDLADCYRRATVFVNPILSGGGMRGKVLEAFASGRPVVSTRLGMEGIAAEDGVHADLADDAVAFARAVVRLLRDPELRRQRGRAARALVEQLYDAPSVFGRLEDAYRDAVAERLARLTADRVA